MAKYILNHHYLLRHDAKRSYIISRDINTIIPPIPVNGGWRSMIHPAYAMMLSFFSEPIELESACTQISDFFSVPRTQINQFLMNLIESKEPTHASLNGFDSGFPINLLIKESQEFTNRHLYSPNDFNFKELDFETTRMLNAPVSIVFMPNNNCYTDCIYCYADTKTRKETLSLEEIEIFLKDARSLNVKDVLITGGDFFMYPNWERLISILNKYNYTPDLISTKTPIRQKEIETFAKLNIRLQISLDSITPDIAQSVLNVKNNYVNKIKETILNIDKSLISYQIATVITNINDSTQELEKLFKFLKELKHLDRWEIRVAFKSLYSKSNFDTIKSSREHIIEVEKWINQNKALFPAEILWSPDDDKKYQKSKGGSRYFEGPVCSANMTNMIILPDGNVTICEQLYWNHNFIIGNIKKNSISEIWNSQKALSIWKRQQNSIKQDSPCRKCSDFKDCFLCSNRCFANIMKAYGLDNFDYPDPRCFFAPKFKSNITHE